MNLVWDRIFTIPLLKICSLIRGTKQKKVMQISKFLPKKKIFLPIKINFPEIAIEDKLT